jgi:hypothetical protein
MSECIPKDVKKENIYQMIVYDGGFCINYQISIPIRFGTRPSGPSDLLIVISIHNYLLWPDHVWKSSRQVEYFLTDYD